MDSAALPSIILAFAEERSLSEVLRKITEWFPNVALARVWLLEPDDVCPARPPCARFRVGLARECRNSAQPPRCADSSARFSFIHQRITTHSQSSTCVGYTSNVVSKCVAVDLLARSWFESLAGRSSPQLRSVHPQWLRAIRNQNASRKAPYRPA